jgi:hypothetical protein
MATEVNGQYYSDLLVGQKEDITDDLIELVPAQTPFLNSIGFPGGGTAYNATHYYLDDAYIPRRTTLVTTITSSSTTIVLTDAIAKAGQRIEMQGERILLGTTTDQLTFSGCTRAVGTTPAAAAHTAGCPIHVLGLGESQGAAAGSGDTGYEPRSVTAYVQEWEKIIDIPDITNNAQRYGRPGKAYDDDATKKLRDLKIEMELSAIWGVAVAPAGSTGTKGWMGGLWDRVKGTNLTAMGTTNFTQDKFRTAVEAIAPFYNQDERVNAVLLCPIRQCFIFDGWAQAHVVDSSDPLAKTYGVNVRRLVFGPMTIDVIGYNKFYDTAVLYQPNYVKWLWYNGMGVKHEALARDGRRTRGMISAASTMEIYCPEAHYLFSGLATS